MTGNMVFMEATASMTEDVDGDQSGKLGKVFWGSERLRAPGRKWKVESCKN